MKWAHLDRRPAGDDGLAPPLERLVQVSGFQHPKTAYMLLGLQVRPVGDEHLTMGLRPQRLRATCWAQAANENPGTSSDHLGVERVDIAVHRFVLCKGRIVLVGDAAYCPSPLTGQGTSLALVGAYVLAEEIARSTGDLAAAAESHERRLRPFVEANLAIDLRTGKGIDDAKNAIAI